MKKFLLFFAAPSLLVGGLFLLSSNLTSPIGISEVAADKTFVGSEACKGCHSTKYDDWIASGHPYKFSVIENDEAPVYPPEADNFQSQWMDSLAWEKEPTHGLMLQV